MSQALHEAAKQAARDERDRLGVDVSNYVVGRIVEAALAVKPGPVGWGACHDRPTRAEILDADAWDVD